MALNSLQLSLSKKTIEKVTAFFRQHALQIIITVLAIVSVISFWHYYQNGLGLAYNDARSHLNIGRRVVEGLKPGLAQLGSVWLPLTHLLMVPTVWNDFMWHSGLAGAIQSMVSFVATGVLIYMYLRKLGVGKLGRLIAVAVFATNINILYLQSTAMTELLLLAAMTAGVYYLLIWFMEQNLYDLIKAAFWIMLSTLVRYDGWFLLAFAAALVLFYVLRKKGYYPAEGTMVLFCTLGGFGVMMWFVWNLLIFKDPLYFAFGPYSAHAQQTQLEAAGNLATKGNWINSIRFYIYALAYNSGAFTLFLGLLGSTALWFNKQVTNKVKVATFALLAPLFFNILALYLGHSVLYIEGLSGNTWFNVRYGVMMMPSIAIFVGYLVDRAAGYRSVIIGLLCFVTMFQVLNTDAVTIEDARVGASQKNVSEVSSWLAENTANTDGFILVSAASHDAIIFSSGLPMKKFIHEGTGEYWSSAIENPDRWARWIVTRTYSNDDSTYRLIKDNPGFDHYQLVKSYPFADIYQIEDEYLPDLNTTEVFPNQK